MQIQASPDETNTTDELQDLLWQKPRNSVPNGSLTRHYVPLTAPEPPTRCHNFLICNSSIDHTRRPIGLVDHRSAYGRNLAFNHWSTRLHTPPGFLASHPCAGGNCMLLSSDVTGWRHHSTSACYIISHAIPNPRHKTLAALLPDPWPDSETRNRPGTCIRWLWPWTSWLWILLTLTFWIDLWPKVKIFERAYLAQFLT